MKMICKCRHKHKHKQKLCIQPFNIHVMSCIVGFKEGNFPFLSSNNFPSAVQSVDLNSASLSSFYSFCSITQQSFTSLHFPSLYSTLQCLFSSSSYTHSLNPSFLLSSLYFSLLLSQTLLIFYNLAPLPILK